jgi:hypothetical protein
MREKRKMWKVARDAIFKGAGKQSKWKVIFAFSRNSGIKI